MSRSCGRRADAPRAVERNAQPLASLVTAGPAASRSCLAHLALIPALLLASAAAVAGGEHGDNRAGNAVGEPGMAAQVSRTIGVDMSDAMRFSPASITVRQGQTVRFVVKNSGRVSHELVLGTDAELKAHAAQMIKTPEMEHADPGMVTVAPGKTGELLWRFSRSGTVRFACLQPGHYDAGMQGLVTVAGAASAPQPGGHDDHKH